MPKVVQINMDSPLYQKERELRNKVLLRPIGIPDFGWEMNDSKSWHFVALEQGKLIGCVLLLPLDIKNKKGQLMQMAVEHTWQGKGIGKLLVGSLLSFARKAGLEEIEIHSRAEVTSFYEQLGFQTIGEEFKEVGIKHRYMSLQL
ncbi:GNAT family N-acetyltransferase [Lutimonas vermicola]|uniref:GNAT family N-acetyltransferase n=1 Tax=Lutimonas vermicola TaxID=414288 RepID=A0ABU9L0A5_9FLAO